MGIELKSSFNKVRRRVHRFVRIALRRNQHHLVGNGVRLILPPEHWLPIRQAELPLYDRYFLRFFGALDIADDGLFIVDVGANVGDTALAISSVAPGAQILCIEGSRYFNGYLGRNIAGRVGVQNLEAFVDIGSPDMGYESDGSTGHLTTRNEPSIGSSVALVSVHALLTMAPDYGIRVWKSDTDGYDIAILAQNFEQITAVCEVIWIEYDPIGILSSPSDIARFLDLVSSLDRQVVIFDNLGHRMLRFPCSQAGDLLQQLEHWLMMLEVTRSRINRISYFDLWILDDHHADLLDASASITRAYPR
jgi:FkbM family methyltransferase